MNSAKYLLAGLMALSTAVYGGVETGSEAPEFTLADTTGTEHSLSDFEGKYVVLEWTNHQCPFVVKHYREGHMQALQKEMTDKGVVWLTINSSAPGKQGHLSPKAQKKLRGEQYASATALLLDPSGEVGKAYDARTTPHMYLIDPEGTLVYQGAIDSEVSTDPDDIEGATNYVVAAYESATSGEAVENATTKPYGCSVKY